VLIRTVYVDGVIDRLTGRITSAGPIFAANMEFRAYTGSQLSIDTQPTVYDRFGTTHGSGSYASAAGGIAELNAPINQDSSAGSPSGTLTFIKLWNQNFGFGAFDCAVGVAGSGQEAILNSLVANSGSSGLTLENLDFRLMPSGDMKANEALLNAMLNTLASSGAAPNMGGSGTIKVYSGSAPSSAEDAPTGTELISFATTTSSWNAASGRSAALASALNATAGATATAGYARWTKGSYTIQGSIGTSGTTFLIDDVNIVNGNSFNLTGATISL
jgi:hypothetical protein